MHVIVAYDENEEEAEDADSSPNSQDSRRMQMGHQVTTLAAYKAGSFLYEKIAELVGALHTLLACQALRKYMKNKRCDSFTAHGLHIHRTVGIIHVEVVLSKGTMMINAMHLFDGVSSPGFFCAIMKYYLDKLKKCNV